MQAHVSRLGGFLAVLVLAASVSAQYGHPLKGSWSGDWGESDADRQRLLLQFDWDGETITGTINPGPNAVAMERVSLDPSTWTIHVEAEAQEPSGAVVGYVIDGELRNLGSYNRVISGTWTQGVVTGDFTIIRN